MLRIRRRAAVALVTTAVLVMVAGVALAAGDDLVLDEPPFPGEWQLAYDGPAGDVLEAASGQPLPSSIDAWARAWIDDGEWLLSMVLITPSEQGAQDWMDGAALAVQEAGHEVPSSIAGALTLRGPGPPQMTMLTVARGRYVVRVEVSSGLGPDAHDVLGRAQLDRLPAGEVIAADEPVENAAALRVIQSLVGLLLGGGVGFLINWVGRRRMVNPWNIGLGAVLLLFVLNAVVAVVADPANASSYLGRAVAAALIPALLGIFLAKRYSAGAVPEPLVTTPAPPRGDPGRPGPPSSAEDGDPWG